MNQTKHCYKCRSIKNNTEFYKNKSKKDGLSDECKFCSKQQKIERRLKNPDKVKEQQRIKSAQWRKNNPEKRKKILKKYNSSEKAKIAQRKHNQQSHTKNRKKEWANNNKDKIAEKSKRYLQTPKGKSVSRAASQNRRARLKQIKGSHTGKEILELFDKQKGKCVYCKCKLNKSGKNKYHVDHIIPVSKENSTNYITNIQLLCSTCNLTKSDKLPEEFAQQFGMLI